MARMKLNQLLVSLYLIVWATADIIPARKISRSQDSHVLRPPSLLATHCYQSPDMIRISCTGMWLKTVPQDLYPRVEELDLSSNSIRFLSNASFTNYSHITNLSLSENFLEEIAVGTFYSLRMLQYINLGLNPGITMISSQMFKYSPKLTQLILSGTDIGSLSNDTLRWLPSLQVLDLSFTKITYINFTSCSPTADKLNIDLYWAQIDEFSTNTFRIDCNLNMLRLMALHYTMIDPQAIASIHTRVLSFSNNSLKRELWQHLFMGIESSEIQEIILHNTLAMEMNYLPFKLLQNKPLQVLDLSGSTIKNLAQMGFLDLPLVSTLILDGCKINDDMDPDIFSRMKGLRILHLNFNKIKYIPYNYDNGSTWHTDLHELYLASNLLDQIHESTFKGLTNLTKLVLRGNMDISFLKITAFTDLKNLKYLDLSDCWLYSVSIDIPNLKTFVYNNCRAPENPNEIKRIFSHTQSIEHVIMNNASLSILWMPFEENKNSLFGGMRNLRSLNLKKNPLEIIQSGALADLLFLQELDLSNCELLMIEERAFDGLQRLQILHLQGNHLRELPHGVLQNMGQLATIHLDSNELKHLEHNIFVNSSKLRNLTLAGNKFTGFNRSTFEPIFKTLASIDVSNNEFGCTCNLKWLPSWLAGSIKVQNENDTRCSFASLEELREGPLMSFKPSQLCGPNIALYVSLPLLVMCMSVILMIAHRHRWFLKYKLFLLKLAVIGYNEIQDARHFDDYEFHFNVIFAEEDEEWVMDHLRPVLEERLQEYNRNVYGDNYLPLGMHYCDAVHYVVDRSYKTIILVSRAAIQDNWFVIKFRTAADQVNDTQIENMVVIFLEDIPDDELPFLVRLYLSDRKPYLSWENEDDERFQEYFWHKLIKMLTINLRCNNVIPPE